MTPDRDHEIADYLAGELSEEDRRRFEMRLEAESDLGEEVEALRLLSGELSASADVAREEPETPPLTLPVEDIPPGRHAATQSRQPAWLRPAFALAAVAAVAAVVAVLATGRDDEPDPEVVTVQLDPFDSGPASASGSLSSESGQRAAALTVDGLEPSAPGTYYEAWLISADQKRLLPLGTFSVGDGGTAEVDVELPAESADFRFLDISLEPDDGDPDHSGESVLRGLAAPS